MKRYTATRFIKGPGKGQVINPGEVVELSEQNAERLLEIGALTEVNPKKTAAAPDGFDPTAYEGEWLVLKPFTYDKQEWQEGETVTIRGKQRRMELYTDGFIKPAETTTEE